MGNCLRHESSMHWSGDDWGSDPAKDQGLYAGDSSDDDLVGDKAMKMEKEVLLGNHRGFLIPSSAATATAATKTTTEVKIKITRKQLEELLGRVDIKELSVHQVLAQLINVSDQYKHQRSWRPALQSIPEVN